ncbi:MAG: helix-turn-helix domain-containing protein [Synergistaceae bacterium]|nr:helix-turn-helix domain-containing protein [Synergistaceae bacterium]
MEKSYGIRQAARALGRDPSSVSREIKRNKGSKGYNHWRAHSLSIERRRKSHPMKRLAENSELWAKEPEFLTQTPRAVRKIYFYDYLITFRAFLSIVKATKIKNTIPFINC